MAYITLGTELNGKEPCEVEGEGHFIEEVWRGLRPLGETFWRYYVLYAGVLVYGTSLVARLLSDIIASPVPILLWIVVIAIPVRVWITVGLWRSATNNPGGWATLVKVLIIGELLYSVTRLAVPIVRAVIELDRFGG